MARRTDRNRFRKDAEAKFAIKIDVPVPPDGLGRSADGGGEDDAVLRILEAVARGEVTPHDAERLLADGGG